MGNSGSNASSWTCASQAACVTACAGFTYNKTTGDLADQTHNNFNCRIYHLEAAFASASVPITVDPPGLLSMTMA